MKLIIRTVDGLKFVYDEDVYGSPEELADELLSAAGVIKARRLANITDDRVDMLINPRHIVSFEHVA